ncbi:MAG: DUF4860 domain-containing protein [Lachnospiraceae bacterium]|nr:DUF4860 domain-containing protein [Lachnospiraceae bacterium]
MRERRNGVNGLLVFLIYGIFALFSLLLVVIGARVYRDITTVGRENTQIRAAFSYVSNKVRMSSGEMEVKEQDGIQMLVLSGNVEGYETRIYYYEGALREIFQETGQPFSPYAGEIIVETTEFTFKRTETGGLWLHTLDARGNPRSMELYLEGNVL